MDTRREGKTHLPRPRIGQDVRLTIPMDTVVVHRTLQVLGASQRPPQAPGIRRPVQHTSRVCRTRTKGTGTGGEISMDRASAWDRVLRTTPHMHSSTLDNLMPLATLTSINCMGQGPEAVCTLSPLINRYTASTIMR